MRPPTRSRRCGHALANELTSPGRCDGRARVRTGLDVAALDRLRHAQQPAGRIARDILTLPELVRLALADNSVTAHDADTPGPWTVETLLADGEPLAEWTVPQRVALLRRLADESLQSPVRGGRSARRGRTRPLG